EYKWSSRFKYILVDEFQDTNLAQYELIKHLSKVNGNITVVGDDDQSIYGWRGAEIRNILNFPIDFKNTKIVKLEKNYRSTKRILELANCVIKNNKLRHEKVLWCDNEVGQKPVLKRCLNEIDEAIEIADEVERILDEGIEPNKLAILYRTNAQSRVFEEEFKRRGIPYQVVGGISFYERAEIKDMLAYLRLVVNPKDDISFRRIANIPARGIGKSSLDKLSNEASLKGLSLYESAKIHCDNIPISASAKKGLANLVNIIEEAKRCAHNVYEALKNIVDNTGYIKMLEAERIAESEDRIGNIYELLSSAYSFVNSHADAPSVERYLSEVSLLTSVDLWEPDAQRVSLMTVHSAKGLEFEYLFVSGLEDGLFPLADAYIDVEKLEEERRLFYVATTRAKKILHLSYALSRRRHGEQTFSLPSKFILEIPKELLYEEKKEPEPQSEDNFQISINSMVYHSYFGRGKVIEIRGYGKNAIVTVYFEEYGIVKLSLAHTQLEVL
ncbi:MAG: ATP-dependent helicase, partial [bacterium]